MKMMKRNTSFFTMIFLTALPCYGRLGDTREDCITRYGNPTSTDGRGATMPGDHFAEFNKDGFIIKITFYHGIVGGEIFKKADGSSLTAGELSALLQAESGGMKWTKTSKNTYSREDGAFANCVIANTASLFSKKFQDAITNFYSSGGQKHKGL